MKSYSNPKYICPNCHRKTLVWNEDWHMWDCTDPLCNTVVEDVPIRLTK